MQLPNAKHLHAIKRILHYAAGTLDFGLHYTKCPCAVYFIGYSDSDHAGNIDTSKSTSGSLFLLYWSLVNYGNWSSSKWWLHSPVVKSIKLQLPHHRPKHSGWLNYSATYLARLPTLWSSESTTIRR